MTHQNESVPDIDSITPENAAAAVEVLVAAFAQESATNYLFPESEGERIEKLRALFDWGVRYRHACKMPVLGLWDEGCLIGVALVRSPAWRHDPPLAQAMWKPVAKLIGPRANARVDLYDQVQSANIPAEPHAYLAAIGVRPEWQGRGHGAKLVRACIVLSEKDPIAQGIALDTGSEMSQAYYERFGFFLHAVGQMEGQTMRVMYRPNQNGPEKSP